jgi:hypothetical protein
MSLYKVVNDKTGESDLLLVNSVNEISLIKWTTITFLRLVD